MTKEEALKDLIDAVEAAIQAGDWKVDGACDPDLVIRQAKEALAQTEQEPVAWLLTDKNINSLQVDSIQRLINRLKHAHHTDIRVRINGQDEWFQADWLKHLTRTTPPQRKPLTEKRIEELYSFWVVDCQDIVGFARAVERTVKGEV